MDFDQKKIKTNINTSNSSCYNNQSQKFNLKSPKKKVNKNKSSLAFANIILNMNTIESNNKKKENIINKNKPNINKSTEIISIFLNGLINLKTNESLGYSIKLTKLFLYEKINNVYYKTGKDLYHILYQTIFQIFTSKQNTLSYKILFKDYLSNKILFNSYHNLLIFYLLAGYEILTHANIEVSSSTVVKESNNELISLIIKLLAKKTCNGPCILCKEIKNSNIINKNDVDIKDKIDCKIIYLNNKIFEQKNFKKNNTFSISAKKLLGSRHTSTIKNESTNINNQNCPINLNKSNKNENLCLNSYCAIPKKYVTINTGYFVKGKNIKENEINYLSNISFDNNKSYIINSNNNKINNVTCSFDFNTSPPFKAKGKRKLILYDINNFNSKNIERNDSDLSKRISNSEKKHFQNLTKTNNNLCNIKKNTNANNYNTNNNDYYILTTTKKVKKYYRLFEPKFNYDIYKPTVTNKNSKNKKLKFKEILNKFIVADKKKQNERYDENKQRIMSAKNDKNLGYIDRHISSIEKEIKKVNDSCNELEKHNNFLKSQLNHFNINYEDKYKK